MTRTPFGPSLSRAALLVFLAACGKSPDLEPVRDVRPARVEVDEKLVIETSVPLETGAPTEVVLQGHFQAPGSSWQPRTITLRNARATAPAGTKVSTRVLVDIDALVQEEVGRASFTGSLTIFQGGKALAAKKDLALDFFPPSVRKLGFGLVGDKDAHDLASWLGMTLSQVPAPDGKGTALRVDRVEQEFRGMGFISAWDCGTWSEKQPACKAPLDGKVARGENGVPDALFDQVDHDGDKWIDRLEAEHAERDASPAALAGVQAGDVLVAAGGRPILGMGDLASAWRGDGDQVSATFVRGPDKFDASLPRHGRPASIPQVFLLIGILVAVASIPALLVPLIGGLIVVWERKVAGRMQSRPGPNRVGPNGWLQWLADGLKLIVKEDITPTDADPLLFKASPYLVFIGIFSTFVVIPFSHQVQVADLNIGILYLLSVTSLVVVGVIMGGWASNSKWSLLGGMRSAAQIISYELPASIAVLTVVMVSGGLSTQGMVLNQGGAPWNWHLFDNPFIFACFIIFFVSALAEGNRTPFDLPEAESELVAGYNTEYSGFRFSVFALAEWVNLLVIGSVVTTVFLGGWQIPGVPVSKIEASTILKIASFLVFAAKAVSLIFVMIWIRWTLPRFRVDQMMNMCWKYFLPISLVSFIGVAALEWLIPYPSVLRVGMRYAMFLLLGGGISFYFVSRVLHSRRTTRLLELRGAN